MSERVDELAQLGGGQRSVDPAVALCQLGVVVVRAEHDLERAAATQEAGEVLGAAAAAGNKTERRLELREDRRLPCREAHVAGEHELAAGGPHAALDLSD